MPRYHVERTRPRGIVDYSHCIRSLIESFYSHHRSLLNQSLKLRQSLIRLTRYARRKLFIALRNVPETILALNKSDATVAVSDRGLFSPVIPVFTPCAGRLANYLLQRGYAVSPMTYPVVKRPRIRVIIHAGNTEEEIDSFTNELLAWAERQESVFSPIGSASGSAGVGESYAEARARL